MPDIVALLWVLFALLLLGAVMYVLYNPPKTLLKLRHRDSEIEIVAPAASREAEPKERQLEGKAGEPKEEETEGPPEAEDTPFAQGYRLLKKGDYADGMAFIREEAETKDEVERQRFLAFGQHIAAGEGSDEALDDLRENARAHPQNAEVAFWLGLALRRRGEVSGAIEALEKSRDSATDDRETMLATTALAKLYGDQDRSAEAIKELTGALRRVTDRTAQARLYSALASAYNEASPARPMLAFAMCELALGSDPSNESLRFEAAYEFSENGADAQALFHYKRLLSVNPEYDNAANNAGVSAGELNLPITQVRYYRKAAELDETLPMANLAGKLTEAGFLPEARELVDSALAKPDPHRNVLRAMGQIAEAEAQEEDKLEKLEQRSTEVVKWRRRYGRAVLTHIEDISSFSGQYSDGNLTLEIKVDVEGHLKGVLFGSERRELRGTLEGAAGDFTWSTKPPPGKSGIAATLWTSSGSGQLIFEGTTVSGYTIDKGEAVDPAGGAGWDAWELQKSPLPEASSD